MICKHCKKKKRISSFYYTSFRTKDGVCKRCRIESGLIEYHKNLKRKLTPLKDMLGIKTCKTCGMELLPYRQTVRKFYKREGKFFNITESVYPKKYCDWLCFKYQHVSQRLSTPHPIIDK